MKTSRIVITGMAVQTPIAESLKEFYTNLLAGRSAISALQSPGFSRGLCKIGGELYPFDAKQKLSEWQGRIPSPVFAKLKKCVTVAPWATQVTAFLGVAAWHDAGLFGAPKHVPPQNVASIAAGHNINMNYIYKNYLQFKEEENFIDPFFSLQVLDTDHAAVVSELLEAQGATYNVGGACASGNVALRSAMDELLHHDLDIAVVSAPVYDFAPVDLHSMCLMGAVSFRKFNENPAQASRPFDSAREGFVPTHGGGAIVLERLDSALRRGARIYAEVLGVEVTSDGNHLPVPSEEGQFRLYTKLFKKTGVAPEQIDFVSAHATSTQQGDLTEVRSLKRFFGGHAKKLKVNAPKSILGHTLWSSAIVELIAAILQMKGGKLHGSMNIDSQDPEVDLDVCPNQPVSHPVQYLLKNSFGFGGINSACILKAYEESGVVE